MIDLITVHSDAETQGNLILMIFHNVKITGYTISPDGTEFTIFYKHTLDESNFKAGELDFETYMWMDDGKTLIDSYDRYTGICINHKWYPRGDMSLSEYVNLIKVPLENEIVEQNLESITEDVETPESEVKEG